MHMNGDQKKMRINFVLPAIGASGGIDVIYKYVELLSERGHDVCIYKELQASNMHRYQSEIKNIVHQVYCTSKAILQKKKWQHKEDIFVFKLTNESVRDADVIIATAWPTAFKIVNLSEKKGRKYYFIQGYEVWDNIDLVKESYKLPIKKIVISSWINDCLKRDLDIGPFPIVHNGLDLKIYHHVDIFKEAGTICFLMLNHTLPQKGVNDGIKVFEEVKKMHENCKLRMFGMCDDSNLPSYVEYYQNPSKQKLLELYSESDIFIFPSLEEGWGLTPLEAMACGCVVVGTNTGFVLDFGKHGENMMISDPGNIKEMVNNIEELLKAPDLVKRVTRNMEKDIRQFKWEKSAEEFEKIICMK